MLKTEHFIKEITEQNNLTRLSASERICKMQSLIGLRPKHMRVGQYFFSMLWHIDSSTAEKITNTSADPFYNESNLDEFWTVLNNIWSEV